MRESRQILMHREAMTSHTANGGSESPCSRGFRGKHGPFMPGHGEVVRNDEWEKLGKKGQEEAGDRGARLSPSQP